MSPSETLEMLYGLVNNIVKAMPNFNINDVLETDYNLLMNLLTEQKSKEEEAMDLSKFVETI